ncbi:MAG: hypothetical protein U1F41_09625 [Burkholderiales bacterium]
MRKILTIMVLVLGCLGAAQDSRAQACPGVSPWVFDDVLASDTFCTYITWMAQEGVSLGCVIIDANHRLFCPDNNVTRKQMSAFMFRLGEALLPSTCGAGQVLKWDGTQWACANDSTGGVGTVTSVAAGTGLTGGTITSSGTIAADTTYLQRRVVGTCGVGSSIRTINEDGSVVCQVDSGGAGTVTSVTATAGGGLATTPGGGISTTGSVGIATGGVQTAMLADSAVTDAKVAGNISGNKIAPGSIAADRLVASQQLPACFDGQVLRRTGGLWTCGSLPPTITTVDSGGDLGFYSAMAIGSDGFPVVSYHDFGNGRLKVAKCINANCSGTATITPVDSGSGVGQYTSIAIGTDGFPVVSYYDSANGDLKVAKCVNAACTGSATITSVDTGGDVGWFTAIAMGTDGFPVVGYYDVTNGDLKVAKCVNAACSGSATITTVDSIGNVGRFVSIAIGGDGLPVLSYWDVSNADLKVAKCANPACTGSATITPVDASGFLGSHTAIAVGLDGFPVVSYFDGLDGNLKVAKCVNAACTGSATITAVDSVGDVGQYTDIAIGTDGFPVVSYYDLTSANLKVAKCANADCTGSAAITAVDTGGNVGLYTAIAIGTDGLPLVSYYDSSNASLKVVKCSNAACLAP